MVFYDYLILIATVVLLSLGNWHFYFRDRRLSYFFIFGSLGLFALGFVLSAFVRGDLDAAYALMLTFLIAYVAERIGFIILRRVLAAKHRREEEAPGEQQQEEGPDEDRGQ
jgi:hypothetical protein